MSPPKPGNAYTRSRREEPPSKKFKPASVSFTDPKSLVTFIVGLEDNTTKFIFHKEVACHHSQVLKAAFNSAFLEGFTQIYELDDVSDGTFKLMIQWLYSQKLNLLHHDSSYVYTFEEVGLDSDQDMHLAGLWVLADRLQMPELQNAVIDAFQSIFLSNESLPLYSYRYVYENTTPNSPLRRFITAPFTKYLTAPSISDDSRFYPHDMLVDILVPLMMDREVDDELRISVEDFYVQTNPSI